MLRLILEASTTPATWALCHQGTILHSGTLTGTVTATLVPSLRSVLAAPAKPDQILVGIGPGSFSGIRSAIASAEGMAATWGCPVLPIRSTGSIAHQFSKISLLGIFSDARRGDIFATFYSSGRLERATSVHPATELPSLLARCTLAVASDDLPGIGKQARPNAIDAIAHLHEHGLEPGLFLEPIHLRPAVAPKR
jgi:tRNA threonylcarbamoyl adenosine modification protein YeaZ